MCCSALSSIWPLGHTQGLGEFCYDNLQSLPSITPRRGLIEVAALVFSAITEEILNFPTHKGIHYFTPFHRDYSFHPRVTV